LLEAPDIDAEGLRRMDDPSFLVALRRHPDTAPVADRLAERNLYKRAVWAELRAVPEDLLDPDPERVDALEREVADAAGVAPGRVVVDVPDLPSMTESSTRVMVNGDIRPLGEASPLVGALERAQHQQWRMGVYAPAGDRDAVGEAAVRVLGLEIAGSRVRTVRDGIHATLDEFQ
jgi:hypothetical protein